VIGVKIKKRILFTYFVILFAFGILFIRLTYVKVIKSDEYYEKALDLWTRNAPIEGRRGNIYDRNGNLIVGSKLTPTLVAIPKQIEDKEYVSKQIASIVGCTKEAIKRHLSKSVSVEILKPEAQKITVEQAMEVAKLNIQGIYIVGDSSRYYPYPEVLSQVIGIVGIDNQGISGIEYIYDEYLKGKKGSLQIFTDAHGDTIDDLSGSYESASSGFDIYLTIDLNIQLSLERVLDNAYKKYTPDDALGLAINPKTSEVLAMVSRPTFDLENYQDYPQEIYNRNLPIWKSYEPGSTFKVCTFSAGLEEGVFSLDEGFYDPGYMIVDGTRIRDWKKGGHGSETFLQVLENSCNPGFMTIGLRLGKEKLFEYIKKFGYGSKTGIDLLGESGGILFDTNKIGNVELATASFGQGNSATPLQVLNAGCAAVNGGILYQPYILKAIGNESGLKVENQPVEIRRVISEETSKKVAYALESVVANGTGRTAFIEGYRVGGKTGTAQIAENGHYLDNKFILSYMGIAPMDDPQIGIYISIQNPHNAIQYGGTTVGPMVKEVMSEALQFLKIEKRADEIPYAPRQWIDKKLITVPNFVGKTRKEIKSDPFYQIIIEGNGDTILFQLPEASEKLIEGGTIILYT
jgi:stage V sporulation protein D